MPQINLDNFAHVLQARGLSLAEVSLRLGIAKEELEAELVREGGPGIGTLNDVARELAVPSFVFFMEELPEIASGLPDFRRAKPQDAPVSRQTIEVIDMARQIQDAALEAQIQSGDIPRATREEITAPKFANEIRSKFDITLSDQENAKDAREFYGICRYKIERKGVFVIQDSYPDEDGSGFALASYSAPLIMINTKNSNSGRRLFTLIHELGHIILNISGISDPFKTRNRTEISCNIFASRFLLPSAFVRSVWARFEFGRTPSLGQVASVARYLKVSQQATIVRLEQLSLVDGGSAARWLAAVSETQNPDWLTPGGGGNTPQEKVKLAKYGYQFARVFSDFVRKEQISDIDLYRISGLKPKWQKEYFNYALRSGVIDAAEG